MPVTLEDVPTDIYKKYGNVSQKIQALRESLRSMKRNEMQLCVIKRYSQGQLFYFSAPARSQLRTQPSTSDDDIFKGISERLRFLKSKADRYVTPHRSPEYREILERLLEILIELDIMKGDMNEQMLRRQLIIQVNRCRDDLVNKVHEMDNCPECT